MFAESYQDYLRKYIELKNGIPSHDTIRRVMGMISPEILQQLYVKWQERLDKNDGELLKKIICIDGKTMRSNKRGEEKASHVVSAWSKEDGFCMGQKAVGEKSNEITAIPELLEKIRIKGQIITIDAMGTQTAIAEKIRQKRADYVLALKKNWKGLKSIVREKVIEQAVALANEPEILLADEPTGAVDTKTSSQIQDLFRQLNRKLGLTIIIVTHDMKLAHKVDRVVMISDGKISTEKILKQHYRDMIDGMENPDMTDETHEEYSVLDKAHRVQLSDDMLAAAGIDTNKVKVRIENGRVVIEAEEKKK